MTSQGNRQTLFANDLTHVPENTFAVKGISFRKASEIQLYPEKKLEKGTGCVPPHLNLNLNLNLALVMFALLTKGISWPSRIVHGLQIGIRIRYRDEFLRAAAW